MAWSFSALQSYETCPKKYWHVSLKKDVKEPPNEAGVYGQAAHGHFEHRLLKDKPLPLDLRHHETMLAKFANAPGEQMGEQKLALNEKLELTGYFDKDVWVRSIIDYVRTKGTHMIVVDWKFGKRKEDFDQIDLAVAMMFIAMPEIETATGMYYWAKEKKFDVQKYTRQDAPAIWNELLPRVEELEEAKRTTTFPPKPGFLCKNWCWVDSCPYKGG